jgi:hypothetical protein
MALTLRGNEFCIFTIVKLLISAHGFPRAIALGLVWRNFDSEWALGAAQLRRPARSTHGLAINPHPAAQFPRMG